MTQHRASIVACLLALLSAFGCARERPKAPASWSGSHVALVGECVVQTGGETIGGLSGIAWSGEGERWIAVSDVKGAACMVGLSIETNGAGPPSARAISVKEPRGRPNDGPIDAEAVAVDRESGAVFVGFERPPAVVRLDARSGQYRRLDVPEEFASSLRNNRAIESVAVVGSQRRREVWAAAENAPTGEPVATVDAGQRCPVLVYDATSLKLLRRTVYVTGSSPAGGGAFCALADWCALPGGSLLALEKIAPVNGGCDGVLYLVREEKNGALAKERIGSLDGLGVRVRGVPEGVSVRPERDGGLTIVVACDNNFARGEHSDAENQIIVLRLGHAAGY